MSDLLEPGDQYQVAWLRLRLKSIQERLDRLLPQRDDGLSSHFHLGRVGGSGRKVRRLNRQRERALERIITRSVEAAPLILEKQRIEQEITFISSGQAAQQRHMQRRQDEANAAQKRKEEEIFHAWPRIPLPPEAQEVISRMHRDYKGKRYCSTCGGITTWLLYLNKETQVTTYGCWHHAHSHLAAKQT